MPGLDGFTERTPVAGRCWTAEYDFFAERPNIASEPQGSWHGLGLFGAGFTTREDTQPVSARSDAVKSCERAATEENPCIDHIR